MCFESHREIWYSEKDPQVTHETYVSSFSVADSIDTCLRFEIEVDQNSLFTQRQFYDQYIFVSTVEQYKTKFYSQISVILNLDS